MAARAERALGKGRTTLQPGRETRRKGQMAGISADLFRRGGGGGISGGESGIFGQRHRDRLCYFCREFGHIQRFCPKREAERRGRPQNQYGRQDFPDTGGREPSNQYQKKTAFQASDRGGPNPSDEPVSTVEEEILCVHEEDLDEITRYWEPLRDTKMDVSLSVDLHLPDGSVSAVMDTGATSFWVDQKWPELRGGTFSDERITAEGADGSQLDVVGTGMLPWFSLWEMEIHNQVVKVMKRLPSLVLIGTEF